MEVLFIALIIVALLIAAVGISVARKVLPGGDKPPPALPTAEHKEPPPEPEIRFRKRPPEKRFVKRVPPPPPKKKEVRPKPQGNGGKLTPKELNLDFNLPCPVMARARRECPCQTCRDLRKKFGV